jgi:hypothetical protein
MRQSLLNLIERNSSLGLGGARWAEQKHKVEERMRGRGSLSAGQMEIARSVTRFIAEPSDAPVDRQWHFPSEAGEGTDTLLMLGAIPPRSVVLKARKIVDPAILCRKLDFVGTLGVGILTKDFVPMSLRQTWDEIQREVIWLRPGNDLPAFQSFKTNLRPKKVLRLVSHTIRFALATMEMFEEHYVQQAS